MHIFFIYLNPTAFILLSFSKCQRFMWKDYFQKKQHPHPPRTCCKLSSFSASAFCCSSSRILATQNTWFSFMFFVRRQLIFRAFFISLPSPEPAMKNTSSVMFYSSLIFFQEKGRKHVKLAAVSSSKGPCLNIL